MSLNRGPHSSTGSDPTEKRTPSLKLLTVEKDEYPQQLLNICKSWGPRGLEPSVTLVTVYKSSMRGRTQFCNCSSLLQVTTAAGTSREHGVITATTTVRCLTAWRPLFQLSHTVHSAGQQNKTFFKISTNTNTGLCMPEINSQDK